MVAKTAKEKMAILVRKGGELGTWGQKKPGFYSLSILYDAAEKQRSAGYEALNGRKYPEAYVLLLRFTKFYDMVMASKPDKKTPEFRALQRQMFTVVDALEDVKARLYRDWGAADEAAAAAAAAAGTSAGEGRQRYKAAEEAGQVSCTEPSRTKCRIGSYGSSTVSPGCSSTTSSW
mmetsp:Transcript_26650/g.84675  ORF Transcript_26650/g.84675 Transcript_26650/m.84675 type:complete len:176 (+) Transcript_26650:51-578(+)